MEGEAVVAGLDPLVDDRQLGVSHNRIDELVAGPTVVTLMCVIVEFDDQHRGHVHITHHHKIERLLDDFSFATFGELLAAKLLQETH